MVLVYDSKYRISGNDLRDLNFQTSKDNLYLALPDFGGLGGSGFIPEELIIIIQQVAVGIAVKVLADLIVSAIKKLLEKRRNITTVVKINLSYLETNMNFLCSYETPDYDIKNKVELIIEQANDKNKNSDRQDGVG